MIAAKKTLADGVWPTAVTPFDGRGGIDGGALGALIEYYRVAGVAGIFGVCQSSEMFFLNRDERLALGRETVKRAEGKLPVILSGHVSDSFADQVDELTAMADLGPEAVVLVTNRLAGPDESDDTWKSNLERLIAKLPEAMPLGFYECPHPYKRLLSPELLAWCATTGRFGFLKDTSCDIGHIGEKLEAIKGSGLKLFNANAATLLDSLKLGGAGYSGVMANFHPALYVRLCDGWQANPGAQALQDWLGAASVFERQCYPVNAKYSLSLNGVPFRLDTRSKDPAEFIGSQRLEVEQLTREAARTAKR